MPDEQAEHHRRWRRLVAHAPVRVADAGGWTDTWFAVEGAVCCVAVGPGAVVEVWARPAVDPDRPRRRRWPAGEHPLLDAAIGRAAPPGLDVAVRASSRVPPGSGVGTSAAVVVALLAALDAAARPASAAPDRSALARAAHAVETEDLGWQSGVQDQVAAALGGALALTVRYPVAEARVLRLADGLLDDRLATVYLGRPHRSTAVHDQVIAAFRAGSASPLTDRRLDRLRRCAIEAAAALEAADLHAWGAALTANTEAQRALHPALVAPDADELWSVARRHGSLGWKVNGAGGDGGSVTVVLPDEPERRAAVRDALAEAAARLPGGRLLDLRPDTVGVVVRHGPLRTPLR